jgi:hypothetical protein
MSGIKCILILNHKLQAVSTAFGKEFVLHMCLSLISVLPKKVGQAIVLDFLSRSVDFRKGLGHSYLQVGELENLRLILC